MRNIEGRVAGTSKSQGFKSHRVIVLGFIIYRTARFIRSSQAAESDLEPYLFEKE
jgi:hypothetical protein